MEIAIVLALLVVAIVLFSLESVPLDISGFALVSALLLTGILKPKEAFAGFGSDTVVMIGGLFVMTDALVRTGVVETMVRTLRRYARNDPYRLAALIMVAATLLSAFISNTAATAVFVPAVVALAKRTEISPSKLLMPLAFAAILASNVTLISSSTNIIISGILSSHNFPPIGMFELAVAGVPIAIIGFLYMVTIGMKLLPGRAEENIERDYQLRDYLTEVEVLEGSSLAGKTLAESRLGSEMDMVLLAIIRGGRHTFVPQAEEVIKVGDVLLLQGRAEDVIRIKDTAGLKIVTDIKLREDALAADDLQLVEAMLMPGSDLRYRTLDEVRFRNRFGLSVLAINRRGVTLRSKLNNIPLRIGDVLLLQGSPDSIQNVINDGYFTLLGDISSLRPRSPKAKYALAIFAFTIALGSFNILPFASAIVIGTLLMFLVRAITPEEAYNAIDGRILVLIGSLIAFGTAMEQSGAAGFLAQTIVNFAAQYGPEAVLGGFFIMALALTQPMSNQAAALVLLPVAIETATRMDLNPRTFAIMIAVAASCSYLTPLEPACMLVYGPGRYRFRDFFKVGALLTVIIFAIAMLIVPAVWRLRIP